MKHGLKELMGYNIETMDGIKADVEDFLFDENSWAVRYLVADFGNAFTGNRVLIPIQFIKESRIEDKFLFIELTQEGIRDCPKPEEDMPVSRKFEEELNSYYHLENYWVYPYPYGAGLGGEVYPPRPLKTPAGLVNEDNLGTSLHSFNEVKGYHIKAIDERLGHVEDMIADDKDWQIVYVLVDTSNWLPWSKKVLLPISVLDDISYLNREAKVNLHTDSIKDAPEFDPDKPVSMQYDIDLHEYYQRSHITQH